MSNVVLERFRNTLFWWLDTLKGSPIKKHLNDISDTLNNFEITKIKREQNLAKLLKHSIQTTPFYKSLNLSEKDFEQFPVINKIEITENQELFKSSVFLNKKNITRSTSGSTGTPFKVLHNTNKIYRNSADTIYFSELAGFKIGYQLWYLRYWGLNFKNSNFKNWAQNLKPIEVINLNNERIENLIKQIKNSSGHKGWLGFPSAFEQVCKFLDDKDEKPIDANFKSIIGMAEGISAYTKQRMAYYFNCPMLSRYSNMENGILAQQTPNSEAFQINWASYHIEILNLHNNEKAPKGELGRIVVTDLYSYAMPLIRYDTGDLGAMDFTVSPPTLKRIEGRKTDTIYNTKGVIVSSFIMINSVHFDGIKQIQLIQESKTNYTIKLNCSRDFKFKNQLIGKFKSFLGEDAVINIITVDEIPLLSSGKRKMTLNKMNTQRK
ncbi:phenylacetate--CoA ligase family protein [Algibacter lectus]|uniref:Phenylacetate-CoA ligase n=1 Tax=Algibacter lectus TaxID=221126 RepID=A0A4R8MCY5_9FLAO|nr:phenylacetate--CoA ligase family protein [Algibacter lectus]MWW23660.1 CoF synthetase [Algibacter lectus]TDY63659.1 phenylacetate-CoA ligase [Algibacter lectus]